MHLEEGPALGLRTLAAQPGLPHQRPPSCAPQMDPAGCLPCHLDETLEDFSCSHSQVVYQDSFVFPRPLQRWHCNEGDGRAVFVRKRGGVLTAKP